MENGDENLVVLKPLKTNITVNERGMVKIKFNKSMNFRYDFPRIIDSRQATFGSKEGRKLGENPIISVQMIPNPDQ
jgi:hypothetical protein